MAIRIIVSDLDGTLMSPDHLTVSERTKKALFDAHKKGIKLAIATGRTLAFIQSVVKQIPFVDYVIYSNGASVYDCRLAKDIYTNHISVADTADILSFLNGLPVYYNVYTGGRIFIQEDKQGYYRNQTLPQKFLEEFVAASTVSENLSAELKGRSAEIFSVYSMSAENERLIKQCFNSKNLLLTSSLPDELEATAPEVNKGTALRGLCEELGIAQGEIMAFGDAMNDSQMLDFAVFSFAMQNGRDELKQIAKFVCASNAEDGVAQAIEKFAL